MQEENSNKNIAEQYSNKKLREVNIFLSNFSREYLSK